MFYADPYVWLGYLFAFGAACAIVLFLQGFFSGLLPLFTQEGNDEHMHKHRVRATWGVLMLFTLFTLWELIRTAANLFIEVGSLSLTSYEVLGLLWLVFFVWYQLVIKKA